MAEEERLTHFIIDKAQKNRGTQLDFQRSGPRDQPNTGQDLSHNAKDTSVTLGRSGGGKGIQGESIGPEPFGLGLSML